MSLKSLINEHFNEQPINNISTSIDIDNINKENICCDMKNNCCGSLNINVVDELSIQQTTKDYNVAGLLKIKLLIPYSEYNMKKVHYVMKYNDIKEIPVNKAMRLIEQGFAMKIL
jgi:hypothetical protein